MNRHLVELSRAETCKNESWETHWQADHTADHNFKIVIKYKRNKCLLKVRAAVVPFHYLGIFDVKDDEAVRVFQGTVQVDFGVSVKNVAVTLEHTRSHTHYKLIVILEGYKVCVKRGYDVMDLFSVPVRGPPLPN